MVVFCSSFKAYCDRIIKNEANMTKGHYNFLLREIVTNTQISVHMKSYVSS